MNACRGAWGVCLVMFALGASGCCCFPLKPAPCGDCVGCSGCVDGSSFALQKYDGCCEGGAPVCVCTGPCACEPTCACEPDCACDPACAFEPACACDPGCAVDPACGCEPLCEPGCACDACADPCGCADCCSEEECCAWYTLKHVCDRVHACLWGCSGCAGEVYWNEWHNDPPRCCDPCDRCGNWVGPSTAYRAPYDHPYAVTK